MIPNFLMQKMVENQLKSLPPGKKEKIISLIDKNPEFFEGMAEDIQKELSNGKDKIAAAMAVAQKMNRG